MCLRPLKPNLLKFLHLVVCQVLWAQAQARVGRHFVGEGYMACSRPRAGRWHVELILPP